MQRSPSDDADVAVELAPERPRAGTAVDDEAEELARRFEGGAVAEVADELCARGSEALFELTMSFLSSYGRMALFRALPLGAVSSARAGDADSSSSGGSEPVGIVWRARCFPFREFLGHPRALRARRCARARERERALARALGRALARTRARTCARTRARTCARTRALAHAHAHSRAHAHALPRLANEAAAPLQCGPPR